MQTTPVKRRKTATKRRIAMTMKMRSYKENWREYGENVKKRRRKRYCLVNLNNRRNIQLLTTMSFPGI